MVVMKGSFIISYLIILLSLRVTRSSLSVEKRRSVGRAGKEGGGAGAGGGVKWDRIAGVVATQESNKSAKHSGVESRAEQKTEKTQKDTQKTEGKAYVCMYGM